MSKSIMTQIQDRCYVCGRPASETHHVFFGTANRRLSEQYGLTVPLCRDCHTGTHGVHHDRELDLQLKQIGQTMFERKYADLEFIEVFGRNYK